MLRAYTGLGRDSDAVETALALNKLYPNDPEVLYHTGRIYGNFAYVVMEKLHDKAPNSIWMLQAQGEANESQKDYDAAIIAFNHVLALDPHRPGIHYRLGRIYLTRFQDFAKAGRPRCRQARISGGTGDRSRQRQCQLMNWPSMAADDNNLEEARKQYEALVARFPDFEQALVGLGGVYLQSQAGAQAVAPLRARHQTRRQRRSRLVSPRAGRARRRQSREGAQKALETFRTLHASSSAAHKPPSADEVTPQQLDPGAQP